jgi:hypothetical protein
MDIQDKTRDVEATAPAGRERRKGLSDGVRIPLLVIGDALIFVIFAAIGRRSHNEAVGISSLLQVVVTALPFAAGWFIVSPFIGAFRRGLEVKPRAMAGRTSLAWLASWPVAMALRGIFVDHTVPPLSFAIITLISNTILLLIWRWPLSLAISFLKRS